jgi:hypothetical protein
MIDRGPAQLNGLVRTLIGRVARKAAWIRPCRIARRPGVRSAASVCRVALACFSTLRADDYLELLLDPIRWIVGLNRTVVLIATIYPVCLVMLGLPQLVFALIGGFFVRLFGIILAPRE